MSYMFENCDRLLYVYLLGSPYDDNDDNYNSSLLSFSTENDIYLYDNNYNAFNNVSSLLNDLNFSSFGDIQNELSESFYSLPVKEIIATEMDGMFSGCSSLISLPDLSKWNTQNVIDMHTMFRGCESLISLPDLSKWNTNNVTQMRSMFYGCKSLISLPDLSKWNIENVTNMWSMFNGCLNAIIIPF